MKSTCRDPFCAEIVEGAYCDKHKRERKKLQRKKYDGKRTYRPYHNSRWTRLRAGFLSKNPLCMRCKAHGLLKGADQLDHVIPHRKDYELMWRESNMQSLCFECHVFKSKEEHKGLAYDYRDGHERVHTLT